MRQVFVSCHPANMKCVTVLTVLIGVSCCSGQFLNNRPYPKYSLEHMPDTSFSCRDKVLGGYYADSETQCQMFHVCVKVSGLGVQDFRFLCPNGTAFDQDSQICADWDDVDCEAATLYYSSDNFDLYRIGSAAFPGEEEDTFHLQRSETGDARLNREHQAGRVNQQIDYNTPAPPKRNFNKERDLFRGSSSSNFFNNRNGGKESDDDYEDGAPNQTSNIPKKKIIRKFNKKPDENQFDSQTQRSNRPTGFANNFAGSSYSTTARTTIRTTTTTTQAPEPSTNYYRGRGGSRRGGDRTYNNAESFRNNNNNQYIQPAVSSSPAPFRQVPERQYKNLNRQNNYETPTTVAPRSTYDQYDSIRSKQNNYDTPTSAAPKSAYNQYESTKIRQQSQYDTPTTSRPNYNQYDTPKVRQQTEAPTTSTSTKQTYNQYNSRQTDSYSTTNSPYQSDYSKQTYKKETENYPTTSVTANKQYDIQKKPTTQYKQPENYPTTYSPNKQNYQKSTTQFYQSKQTENYPTTQNKQPTQNDKQYDQYNKQSKLHNTNLNPTTQNVPTTHRPTTQHTQYTPTVPKQTTQYQYPTTTPNNRYSNKHFDEVSYDDGSYNPKYDDEKYKPDDEFLKTAHSINFANSRNEYSNNQKVSNPTTQSPRPFSITATTSKQQNYSPQNIQREQPKPVKPVTKKAESQSAPSRKKSEKNVSYDYAYYDTNVGSEPDYDIGTEFEKSNKKTT